MSTNTMINPQDKEAWLTPQRMALLGAAAGFLDPNGGTIAGFHGAMNGLQIGNQMKQLASQQQMAAMKLQKQMEVQDYLKRLAASPQASDPVSMGNALINSGHQELMTLGANLLKSKTAKSFLKGLDQNGNPTYYTGYSTGEVSPTGVTPAEKLMQVNEGNQITARNPYNFAQTGSAVPIKMSQGEAARLSQQERQFGMSHGLAQQNAALAQQNSALNQYKTMMELNPDFQAKKAGAIASARESGKIRADTLTNLPQTLGTLAESLNLSDELKNHPAMGSMVGNLPKRAWGNALAVYGGNDQADFSAKMEQAQGKQFLSAIQAMKGFGQLTEVEGAKMQASVAAMSVAQRPEDFKKAQDDYQAALMSGVRKVAAKSGMREDQVMDMLNKERSALKKPITPPSYDGWGDLR